MKTIKFSVAVVRACWWLLVARAAAPLGRRTCEEWFGCSPSRRFYAAVRALDEA